MFISAAPVDAAEDGAPFRKAADASAMEVLAQTGFYRSNGTRTIRDVSVAFDASVPSAPFDYGSIIVEAINTAGGVIGVVGTVTNKNAYTAWVAADGEAGALTTLNDGEVLTFRQTKAGIGTQFPSYCGVVRFG